MRTGVVAATGRLLLLQASWTFERLQGVGMGYASLPLLDPLASDPERHRAAVARSAELFNAHPYFAGIAVGAAARAELDGEPGDEIRRMKTALAGPLGALGDQLFWVGVVPAVAGALLIGVALGGSVPAVLLGLALYIVVRVIVTLWALETGLNAGIAVPRALAMSGLQGQIQRVGRLAGFAIGLALPLVGGWLAVDGPRAILPAGLVGLVAGLASGLAPRSAVSARRITMAVLAVLALSGALA